MSMKNLKIESSSVTLVDQVEKSLLEYFANNGLKPGSTLPSELELASALGVARSVLREALSRLKMIGLIETRTRRGMIMTEPSLLGPMKKGLLPQMLSDQTIFDILGFRIALEIGICDDIFFNITPEDIQELEEIVMMGEVSEHNEYTIVSEFQFHSKLYEITGNKTISEFQNIIHDVMTYVKVKFKEYFYDIAIELKAEGKSVTHKDLLTYIKSGDKEGYRKAIEEHFALYKRFMRKAKLEKNKSE